MSKPLICVSHYQGWIDEVCRRSIWLRLQNVADENDECLVQILKRKLPRSERKRILLGRYVDVKFGYYNRHKGKVSGWDIRFNRQTQETPEVKRERQELFEQLQELLSPIDNL